MGILTEDQIAEIRRKYPSKPRVRRKRPQTFVEKGCVASSRNEERAFWASLSGKTKRIAYSAADLETYVYFIQSEENKHIKIGLTQNLDYRLKSLQSGSAAKLYYLSTLLCKSVARAREIEQKLHKAFSFTHIHGEWFAQCSQLVDFIAIYKKDDEALEQQLNQMITKKDQSV